MNKAKFKAGDVAIRIGGSYRDVEEGGEYVVADCTENVLLLKGHHCSYDPTLFKLKDESFDLKTNAWFIRYDNEQEFNAVRDFVKSKGLEFQYGEEYLPRYKGVGMYFDKQGNLSQKIHRMSEEDRKDYNIPAIKVTFKNVVTLDKLEYPKVESETQKKIRELEESAAQIQRQIEELKNLQK